MGSSNAPMRVSPEFARMVMVFRAREIIRTGKRISTSKVTKAITKSLNQDVLWNEFIKL